MSEYQYYEWQTIDRPLTLEEQTEIKRLSSHIDVMSTRAVVTYNWSSFGHNAKQVLAHYFDAFMYHFEWGIQRLMFRFPKHLLHIARIEPYLWEYRSELEPAGDYLILEMALYDEDRYSRADQGVTLSMLAPLRNDILSGDYRVLYLAWLRAAQLARIDEEVEPPPVPAGLRDLSASAPEERGSCDARRDVPNAGRGGVDAGGVRPCGWRAGRDGPNLRGASGWK